ncbi:MAG TPA: DUF3857 domain-containing transglutaminase family protein [Telluria sp.]|nr:DUF3857 domain-containing transglutaminase family protein [Telluria sp.]
MINTARLLRALLVCGACLAGGAASGAPDQLGQLTAAAERGFARGAPVPAWVVPAGPLPPASTEQAAAIRLADLQERVEDKPVAYIHRALTANDPSALAGLGQYDIEFQPEYQRIELHGLRVWRSGVAIDKLASAQIRFLQRELGLEQGLYSGRVTASIVLSDLRVGDTLDVEYSIIGANPVLGKAFHDAAQWDYSVPVAWRRIILLAPEGRAIHYRVVGNGTGAKPLAKTSVSGGWRSLLLEARAMPAVLGEPSVPRDVQQYRWIQFSENPSWQAVNAWAMELFQASTPRAALAVPLKPIRAVESKEEQIARVLQFVQNEIRYLSLAFGESSHRPAQPADVLARRYGDCKDKTLLVVTMLRELGIEAYPVLLSTAMRQGLGDLLPSTAEFDHAIVLARANGRDFYLDPTRRGQYGPLDHWGQVHTDAKVLVVAPGTSVLSTVPPGAPATLLHERTESVVVRKFGEPAEFEVRSDLHGVAAEQARVYFSGMSKVEMRKLAAGLLIKRYPDAELVGDLMLDDDQVHNRFRMGSRFRIAHLVEDKGAYWQIAYSPSNMVELFAPPGNAARVQPLDVPAYPDVYHYRMEVLFPDSVRQRKESVTDSVTDKAFTFRRDLNAEGRSMQVALNMSMGSDRVAPEHIGAYLLNIQKLQAMLGGTLMLYKSELAAVSAPAQAQEKAQAAKQRLEALIANVDRTVADGEATGGDIADALCERALAAADLGRAAEAERDANRAVRLQPQSGDMLRCRGDVFFVLGRLQESEADLSKALARGAGGAQALFMRGLARLYLAKEEAAGHDFALAAEKSTDPEASLRADILREVTGGERLAQVTADGPDLAWLAAARDMFSRRESAEKMLSLAMRGASPPDRLTEAYYYAGRYALATGNPLKARIYFQQAVAKQAVASIYHAASQHELKRLSH